MKILFVCTGNTCRSPMAAALMNKIAENNDLDISADSAGIYADAGEPASDEAIAVMSDYGIDLSSHSSRNITDNMIAESDLILTMTEGHKMMTSALAPDKIFTICEFAGYDGDIIDPFGGDVEEYEETAEAIYDCLTEIAEKIADFQGDTKK